MSILPPARIYLVVEDERLDRIARSIYGSEGGGTVEALLDANPGLAALGGHVPAGREIVVPTVVEVASTAVRPWI